MLPPTRLKANCQSLPMTNYIYEYYQKIQDGSITVGTWIALVYKRIISDLERKEYFFDQKKADNAVNFIENFTHHSKGKLAPGLIQLELWQKAMISSIFGLVDANGLRQFREVIVVCGRKCGKSILASGVAQKMVFGSGEKGADTYFLAPKLDQADIVYGDFVQSIEAEPELKSLVKRRRSDIYVPSTNSCVKKLPFSQKKADGLNPQLTICDEIGAWPGDAGLKQYEVMASALAAREQPLIFSITTANYVSEGIYDELLKRSTAYLNGNSREKRLLPFLYMIDDICKWNDINELQKSLPNLGVSVSIDFILEEIAKAEGSLSKKTEFLTKYCNIKQNSSQAWLPAEAVEAASGPRLELGDFRGSYCVGGIDLSRTTDLTCCCVVIEKNDILYVFSKFFLPAAKIEEATARDGLPYRIYIQRGILQASGENFVDYEDCYQWFRELVEKYEIYPLITGYDRYNALQLTQEMKQYGFHLDDVYQGENLTPVIRETEGLLKDGKFNIGDNDLLKCHLLDSALKQNTETERVRLIKLTKNGHIDGAAALLDAMTVRQKYYNELAAQLKNT